MLRLLVDRGVELNHLRVTTDGGIALINIWDHITADIMLKWATFDGDHRIQQLEIMHALLECGAESDRSERKDSLDWLDFILCTSFDSSSGIYEANLIKTVVEFCERRIDPYWRSLGDCLWLDFICKIHKSGEIQDNYVFAKAALLVMIKKFLGLGAKLNATLDNETIGFHDLTATEVLASVYTTAEMEELESVQRKAQAESSKAKTSRAQRRLKKKQRKARKRERDVEATVSDVTTV